MTSLVGSSLGALFPSLLHGGVNYVKHLHMQEEVHRIHRRKGCKQCVCASWFPTRRNALLLFVSSIPSSNAAAKEPSLFNLERYSDQKEGFTLLKPSNWNKVDKAGANVLFEDPIAKSNNVGVVVNPVRISSLKDFDTPRNIADKLLAAERKKPSTNNANLIQVQERNIHGNIPVYEFEYTLDSSRGIKRVFAAVTVASKRLYLLNIAYADSPDKPLLPNTRTVLEEVLHSFDIIN